SDHSELLACPRPTRASPCGRRSGESSHRPAGFSTNSRQLAVRGGSEHAQRWTGIQEPSQSVADLDHDSVDRGTSNPAVDAAAVVADQVAPLRPMALDGLDQVYVDVAAAAAQHRVVDVRLARRVER